MKHATAILSARLDIECPFCEHDIDLIDTDEDGSIRGPIFNNKWEDLKDFEVYCPECKKEFLIGEILW